MILTGQPPFAESSVETTRLQAAQGNVEECFARLDVSGAEPELVSLCKRCLSKKPGDRPADAGEVAKAVAALRAAADERARHAELDRVKAEGDKVAAELRVEGEQRQVEEQRKRRRVQLVLAGVVVTVLAGAGVATALVLEKQSADKLTAEKLQSEERFAAEQKRQKDLRAADVAAVAKQRQVRAGALVQALESASTSEVPRLAADLKEFRDLSGARLRELAALTVSEKPGLHARLALLADEPERIEELAAYLLRCRPEELQPICTALKAHVGRVWGHCGSPSQAAGRSREAGSVPLAHEPPWPRNRLVRSGGRT